MYNIKEPIKNCTMKKRSNHFYEVINLTQTLEKRLSFVQSCTNDDGIKNIVKFFTITSEAHDKFKEMVEKIPFHEEYLLLSPVFEFFKMAGRNTEGWNPTNTGEIPTPENIFIKIGDEAEDSSFETRSVKEHLSRIKNPKGEIDHLLNPDNSGQYNETELISKVFVVPFMEQRYKFLQRSLQEIQTE